MLASENTVADFFCSRYYDLDRSHINDADGLDEVEKALHADLEACDNGITVFLWVMYFPLAIFQFHNLKTLHIYGDRVLNLEIKDILFRAEDDV